MNPDSNSLSLQTVERALRTIELLVQAPEPMSVREIAARIGINRTTAHRLINTLLVSGWLERGTEGGYQLSIKYLALGQVANQNRSFLTEIRPHLMRLSQRSRETVHVGVLDGFEVLHVDKIESLERVGVSSRIGTRGAIHATSLGLALIASQPESARARYVAWAIEADGDQHWPMSPPSPGASTRLSHAATAWTTRSIRSASVASAPWSAARPAIRCSPSA
jgi:DNA-binding IclR family transcriptional regulator